MERGDMGRGEGNMGRGDIGMGEGNMRMGERNMGRRDMGWGRRTWGGEIWGWGRGTWGGCIWGWGIGMWGRQGGCGTGFPNRGWGGEAPLKAVREVGYENHGFRANSSGQYTTLK
ncbi:hypothetical protein EDB84DRAFT_1445830 [Lactarius hengduanensis]|nr:hypothetical protein EDB84DRAFT_1445830 [Lactarius hengduanensis]